MEKINEWDEGLKLINELWNTDYGTIKHEWLDTHTEQVVLTTGGWSENEEAIDKLVDTMFWILYWQKSERGGRYTFTKEVID